jgi:patatin-like phospholipase/acyl hydrolase
MTKHRNGSLALDGGGIRGILTLRTLAKIEKTLKGRHGGGDDLRFSHHFDLIAGTSTEAIMAAALAIGMKVDDISKMYLDLGQRVFKKSRCRSGVSRALYDEQSLTKIPNS